MSPLIWIPFTIVFMFFNMWASYLSNQHPDEIRWFFINWFVFACTPVWAVIALYSKDLVFDALLFDITIVISCAIFTMYFTNKFISLNIYEGIGIVTIIIGFLIFKIGEIK